MEERLDGLGARFGRPSKFTFREFTSSGGEWVAPERPASAPAFRRASLAKEGVHVQEWKWN